MGWLALSADGTERFNIAQQRRNQETLANHHLATRERKLRRWVIVLFASSALLSVLTTLSVLGLLHESSESYRFKDETALQLYFFGMIIGPILTVIALYHGVGLTVRLRAWRQILADLPQQGQSE
jgi:hypothetical protein